MKGWRKWERRVINLFKILFTEKLVDFVSSTKWDVDYTKESDKTEHGEQTETLKDK